MEACWRIGCGAVATASETLHDQGPRQHAYLRLCGTHAAELRERDRCDCGERAVAWGRCREHQGKAAARALVATLMPAPAPSMPAPVVEPEPIPEPIPTPTPEIDMAHPSSSLRVGRLEADAVRLETLLRSSPGLACAEAAAALDVSPTRMSMILAHLRDTSRVTRKAGKRRGQPVTELYLGPLARPASDATPAVEALAKKKASKTRAHALPSASVQTTSKSVAFLSLADAQAAADAGRISTGTIALIEGVFAQPDPPGPTPTPVAPVVDLEDELRAVAERAATWWGVAVVAWEHEAAVLKREHEAEASTLRAERDAEAHDANTLRGRLSLAHESDDKARARADRAEQRIEAMAKEAAAERARHSAEAGDLREIIAAKERECASLATRAAVAEADAREIRGSLVVVATERETARRAERAAIVERDDAARKASASDDAAREFCRERDNALDELRALDEARTIDLAPLAALLDCAPRVPDLCAAVGELLDASAESRGRAAALDSVLRLVAPSGLRVAS